VKKLIFSIILFLSSSGISAEVSRELTGIDEVKTYVSLGGDYQNVMLDERTISNLIELELMQNNISIIDRDVCNATQDVNTLNKCIESPALTSNVLVLQISTSNIFSIHVELRLDELASLPRLRDYNFTSANQYATSWDTGSIISCQSDRCPSFVREVIENQLKEFILGIYKANAEVKKLSH
jgi:hypothetical protein